MIDYATPKDRDFDINQLEGIIEEEKPEVNTAVPKFDPNWLPPVLRDMAAEVAQSKRVPFDFPACVGLGAASLCACGRISVKVYEGWIEPAQLFIGVCAPSGRKKSPVFKCMTDILKEWQYDENQRRAVDIKKFKIEEKYYEEKIHRATKAGKLDEAKELAERLTSLKPVYPMERFKGGDLTPESVADVMSQNDNAVSILDDEAQLLENLFGRYSDLPNLAPFLQAYSGGTIQVTRKSRPTVDVRRACMAILLTVQPEAIDEIVQSKRMKAQGFIGRFLFTFPDEYVRLVMYPPEISKKTEDAYNNKLREIYNSKKRTFTLSPRAYQIMMEYLMKLEDEVFVDGKHEALQESNAIGKVNGSVNRLAAILKLWGNSTTDEIDADTMEKAIAIQNYFNAQLERRYGEIGRLSKYEKNLLNQIAACELPVSEYELRRIASEFRRKKAPPFEEAIARLCELGYIKRYKAEKSKSVLIDLLVKVKS